MKDTELINDIKFIPAPNRILVEQKLEDAMSGKIIKPDSTRSFTPKGTIVKLGKVTDEKPQLYKLGDVVYFSANATTIPIPIKQGDRRFIVVNQHDIYGTE